MKTISEALECLFEPTKCHPDWAGKIAFTGENGVEHSFSDLEAKVCVFIKALKNMGLKHQDKVIICSPNSPEYVALLIAIWKLGAVTAPIDFRLTLAEAVNVTNAIKAKAFFGAGQTFKAIDENKEKLWNPEIPISGFQNLATAGKDNSKFDGMTKQINTNLPCLLIFTSGTTGAPKAAVHDLLSLVSNMLEFSEIAQVSPDTTLLLPLPLSHIFGIAVSLAALLSGASISFTLVPADFIKALLSRSFDIVAGVPALYNSLLAQSDRPIDMSKSRVLLCGGAPLPESLANEFEKKFGKRLNNGYGSTESKIVALNLDGPERSVGKLAPSAKAIIFDYNHRTLPEGETGEICLSGPMLMQGYFQQASETEKVLHQGHYHTGDLGYIKDGYLFVSGREKELINVAGNKVFPSEVEDVLRRQVNVKEVAVLGVPHYRLGQLVKAVIVINDPDLSERLEQDEQSKQQARQDLLKLFREYCRNNLKKELRPLAWEFLPSRMVLPKTNNGKIDKRKLQAATTYSEGK